MHIAWQSATVSFDDIPLSAVTLSLFLPSARFSTLHPVTLRRGLPWPRSTKPGRRPRCPSPRRHPSTKSPPSLTNPFLGRCCSCPMAASSSCLGSSACSLLCTSQPRKTSRLATSNRPPSETRRGRASVSRRRNIHGPSKTRVIFGHSHWTRGAEGCMGRYSVDDLMTSQGIASCANLR